MTANYERDHTRDRHSFAIPLYLPGNGSKVAETRRYAVDLHLFPRTVGGVFRALVLRVGAAGIQHYV